MRTATKFFPLMMVMIIFSLAGNVNGQGSGHHKDHDRDRAEHQSKKSRYDNHHHRDRKWESGHHHHGEVHHHYRDRYAAHYHDRRCSHTRVVRHYDRPRYIYYRDYDVYYDIHQSVYISWSGRNWAVSTSLPVVLQRVDRHRAIRIEVDYHHDDLTTYLSTGRPVYRRIYAGS